MHPVELLQKRFDVLKKPSIFGDSEQVEILASRLDEKLNAVFFRVAPSLEDMSQPRHVLAFFTGSGDASELKLSHELDMDALWHDFCTPAGEVPAIRQLGDGVLHQKALQVLDVKDPAVLEQIHIMKEDLIATGGVGIAANQCARIKNPLSIVLSGVDYTSSEHVAKVMKRYPSAFFPPMMICINPEVIHQGEEKEFFAEGCLSARSPLRAQVSRAREVTVRYQDPMGEWREDFLQGSDARVMLHEIDHIQNGKVYIQHIFDEMTAEQCEVVHALIDESLRRTDAVGNPMQNPVVLFDRDDEGHIVFAAEQAKKLFEVTDSDVLRGMSEILQSRIHHVCSLRRGF